MYSPWLRGRKAHGLRLATTIIALVLMLIVGLQSCAAYVGGGVTSNQDLSGAGAVGLLIALLFLIGAAFAIGVPIVSVGSFVLAALLALAVGFTSEFVDLRIWGFVSLVLAVMSYSGFRARRRSGTRQDRELT